MNINKSNSSGNYKTMMCKNFEKEGNCRYGNSCNFAHGDEDLRQKGEMSKNEKQADYPIYQSQPNNMYQTIDQNQYLQYIMAQAGQTGYPMMSTGNFNMSSNILT